MGAGWVDMSAVDAAMRASIQDLWGCLLAVGVVAVGVGFLLVKLARRVFALEQKVEVLLGSAARPAESLVDPAWLERLSWTCGCGTPRERRQLLCKVCGVVRPDLRKEQADGRSD